MVEVLVWLLINTSSTNANTLGQFKTENSCKEVLSKLEYPYTAKCIKANIYIQEKR